MKEVQRNEEDSRCRREEEKKAGEKEGEGDEANASDLFVKTGDD